jgi:hypothetical protein
LALSKKISEKKCNFPDSLTDGWGDDGKVLARRNPPANTSNSKNEKSSSRHCQQKNEHDF